MAGPMPKDLPGRVGLAGFWLAGWLAAGWLAAGQLIAGWLAAAGVLPGAF